MGLVDHPDEDDGGNTYPVPLNWNSMYRRTLPNMNDFSDRDPSEGSGANVKVGQMSQVLMERDYNEKPLLGLYQKGRHLYP